MGRYKIAVACLLVLSISTSVFADNQMAFGEEKLKISIGAFIVDVSSDSKLSNIAGAGPVPFNNVQNTFVAGVEEDHSIFRIDGWWRFAPRHRLLISHYSFDSDTSRFLQNDVIWEDVTFQKGSGLTTNFSWDITPISYAYSFFKTDDRELAVAAGFHYVSASINLTGNIVTNQQNVLHTEASSVSGPLPHLGLIYEQQLGSDWLIGARLSFFSLEYGDYDGSMIDAGIYAEYLFGKSWSAGVGYNYFKFDVDIEKPDWIGELDHEYGGIQAYLSKRF